MKTIYVQIASFRDHDLLPTVVDCLAKAKYPERVTFGICWQTDDNDRALKAYEGNKQVRIYRCNWIDSKGCCWARSITNHLYEGEDYTLQIDSHSRFAQDWDEILVNSFEELDDDFALFSGYPPSFELDQTGTVTVHPFGDPPSGVLGVKAVDPSRHVNYQNISNPSGRTIRSRLIAAGFVFARGHLITNVPYDPLHYYLGEEISYAVRAYTHGYNIYTPPLVPVYHLYYSHVDAKNGDHGKRTRSHDGGAQDRAFLRLKALLVDQDFSGLGAWGPGKIRTVDDYQRYAGIDFKTRKVHPDARQGKEPNPITCTDFNWVVPFAWGCFDYTNLFAKLDSRRPLVGCHVTLCDESEVEAFCRYWAKPAAFFESLKLKVFVDCESFTKLTILPLYTDGFGDRVEERLSPGFKIYHSNNPESEATDYAFHNDHQSYVIILPK